jgi:putative membrane protein
MVRTLIKVGLTIAGNAIGLIVAAVLLDDVHLDGAAFILAVVIFTVAELILEPLIEKMVTQHAERLRMFTSLVTTFLALLVTDLISDGLDIEGATTWLLATVIVWAGTLLAGVILVRLFLKDRRDDRRDNR